jgi:hypothetical protein
MCAVQLTSTCAGMQVGAWVGRVLGPALRHWQEVEVVEARPHSRSCAAAKWASCWCTSQGGCSCGWVMSSWTSHLGCCANIARM